MGRIVVGIDESDAAQRALKFALEEASLRSATLRVVHAWMIPVPVTAPDPILGGMPSDYGVPMQDLMAATRDATTDFINRTLAAAGADAYDVEVEPTPVEAEAATALLDAAKDADLLIVGSRGRGGFSGLVLGSVSQKCAHHASCPVVIVPGQDDHHRHGLHRKHEEAPQEPEESEA